MSCALQHVDTRPTMHNVCIDASGAEPQQKTYRLRDGSNLANWAVPLRSSMSMTRARQRDLLPRP
jgi:hypothetical protein